MKRLRLTLIDGDKIVEETISWEEYLKFAIGGAALLGNTVESMNRRLKNWNPSPLQRPITPLERSKGRSEGYHSLPPEDQWAEDKRLGILDWDGK